MKWIREDSCILIYGIGTELDDYEKTAKIDNNFSTSMSRVFLPKSKKRLGQNPSLN